MEQFLSNVMTKERYISVAIVIIGAIIYVISINLIKNFIKKNENNPKLDKRKKTYLKLFKNILKYVLLIIVSVIILQINGVNVSSIIASLGVITVIVGFALQDALKDIIIKKYIENHNVKRKTIIANMRKCLLNEDFLIEVLAYYCSSL